MYLTLILRIHIWKRKELKNLPQTLIFESLSFYLFIPVVMHKKADHILEMPGLGYYEITNSRI